jgi:hypothetical protein
MDRHRLAEQRSLEFHRIVAERIRSDPGVLDRARRRVQQWLAADPEAFHARAWAEALAGPTETILALLVDPGERARELRQSTPFAGVLGARERWKLWREVAQRTGAGS